MLAISLYLLCLPSFVVQVDHKPLIPLLNTKALTDAPLRCQRMLMRMMRYNAKALYVPGSQHCIPDCLSRQPVQCADADALDYQQELQDYVAGTFSGLPVTDGRLAEIREKQQQEDSTRQAIQYTMVGWPPEAKQHPLYAVRSQLSVANGILMYASRVVIPCELRNTMLSRLHDDGHVGLTKCRERANTSVWWPGLSRDLSEYLAACQFCQIHAPVHRKEPLLSTPMPERPWSHIATDMSPWPQLPGYR